MSRLDALRGAAAPVDHNARGIAALAANPGCDRRAVMDAAGIDMRRVAAHLGYATPFGQSPFAIERARRFREIVMADDRAHLRRLLGETLGVSVAPDAYQDLAVGDDPRPARQARTADRLRDAVAHPEPDGAILDRPLLTLGMAGAEVYLDPDFLVAAAGGRLHVVTVKSFAIIDGQADSAKAAAAAREAAVYVHALRDLLARLGRDPLRVAHEALLVCPRNFANEPTGALVDVRRELGVLARQLARLTRIERILDRLPPSLSLDLRPVDGTPTRPAAELAEAVGAIEARYAPECLASCEMAYFCRAEARACGSVSALGRAVRDELGGVESVGTVLDLAEGAAAPDPDQEEIAARLRYVHRIHAELAGAMA